MVQLWEQTKRSLSGRISRQRAIIVHVVRLLHLIAMRPDFASAIAQTIEVISLTDLTNIALKYMSTMMTSKDMQGYNHYFVGLRSAYPLVLLQYCMQGVEGLIGCTRSRSCVPI